MDIKVFFCISLTLIVANTIVLLRIYRLQNRLSEHFIEATDSIIINENAKGACSAEKARVKSGIAGGFGMGVFCSNKLPDDDEKANVEQDDICVDGTWVKP